MMQRYYEGGWRELPMGTALGYIRPGYYEEATEMPTVMVIHRNELNQLIDFLFKNGYIKPQLGENRTEDIKIIHRLIDVVERSRNDA